MKFRRTILAVSISTAIATLSACGGGGGGGGIQTAINNQLPVPYYTPTRVGSVTPVNSTEREYDSSSLYAQSFSGNGQEILIAGRMAPDSGSYYSYNLNIFGWSNGTLVNQTSQWFSGTDNVIVGTEPSVQFADFDNDGKVDMFIAPNTDTNQATGPGILFYNNGTNFVKSTIDLFNANAHGSAIYDLDRDGYIDIVTTGMRMAFGGPNRAFTVYTPLNYPSGGASVAVADFLGNSTSTIIATDVGNNGVDNNRLYSWNKVGNDIILQQEAILPTPRFLLPKWSSYNFTGSHDIRVIAFDFDNSGRTSAVIFSRPWLDQGQWPAYSEIQFLKNQGSGTFVDVTDTTLVGYNTSTPSTYNPTLLDVNNDGLIDIVLPAGNWESNAGAQVLIHTKEHKYVSSYATVLKAFQDQSFDLEKVIHSGTVEHGANGIVFVQGPDNTLYLVTAVSYSVNNIQQKAIYLSKVGATSASSQATVDSIKQTWPWMTDAQVNTVLAQSSTTWFGLNVLDPTKTLQPIGDLKILANNKLVPLAGSIGGVRLNASADQIKVLDSIGRDFTVNYSSTNYKLANQWSRMIENIDDDTRGAQLSGMNFVRYNGFKFAGSDDNRYAALGITGIKIGQNTELSVQYSRMPFSPFVQLNGSWGLVKDSSTFESTITNRQGAFVSKLGLMYSSTEIEKGMVQRINPITSAWAETGYEWTNFKMYGGILPKVIAGTADITLPTGIDNTGRISYTNTRADVYSPTVTYARFNYSDRINKKVTYRVNGIVTSQQQHSIIGDVQISF